MPRTKTLFFVVSLAWIFLVLASRGLVTLPEVSEVEMAEADSLAKAMNSNLTGRPLENAQRNPAQISELNSVKKLPEDSHHSNRTIRSPHWIIEPLTLKDQTLLKK